MAAGSEDDWEADQWCHDVLPALEEPVAEVEDDGPAVRDPEYQDFMKWMRERFDHQLLRRISTLHDQSGHISARALAKELSAKKYPKEWVVCALSYASPVCFDAQKPQLERVSSPPAAQCGNHVVDVRLRRETALGRMTMSGATRGSSVTEGADPVGIMIDLVPKQAHHRLARPERNPVARRHQLWVFERVRSGARPAPAPRAKAAPKTRLRYLKAFLR